MLTFFRKYQKVFFLFTTIAVITSFIFWGAMGAMDSGRKGQEEPLVRSLNGSMLTKQRVEKMVQFLSSSQLDLTDDKISHANLLNDGIIEKDFLSSPLGALLAKAVFPDIKGEVFSVVSKARSFHSYRHPGSPFLSAESLWSQFSPDSVRLSQEITRPGDVTPKLVEQLGRLYVQQKSIPFSFLRKVFSYQEGQDSRVKPDPTLVYADLSLLGLHSLEEWVGPTYVKAAALCIFNGSAKAQSLGFSLSTGQARQQLVDNLMQAAKKMGQDLSLQDAYSAFIRQVRNMGMEEGDCIALWKDISLFRKLISSFGSSLDLDPKELLGSVKEQADIELFALPSSLQLQDFSSFLKLQTYIEAVSGQKNRVDLPKSTLSLADIEKNRPEIVQRDYVIEYASADVKQLALQVSLKEMWVWQKSDFGWSLLQKQFSALKDKKASKIEERFAILESLDQKVHADIDQFSRETIFLQDKERLQKAIRASVLERAAFSVNGKGDGIPFKDLKSKENVLALLEEAALDGDLSPTLASLEAKMKLEMYTQDQKHYYVIHVLERSPNKKLMTFAESCDSGILQKIVDKKLEEIYVDVRKKEASAYTKKDGSWKPLSEVKDKVGLALFPGVIKAIQTEYSAFYGKEPSSEQKVSPSFYAQYRMLPHLVSSLQQVQAGKMQKSHDSFAEQWDLISEHQTVLKSKKELFASEDQFYLPEGSFSLPSLLSSGKGAFFRMIARSSVQNLSPEEEEAIMAPKRAEAEKNGMIKLLGEMQEAKAFCLEKTL